ncbi:MAG: T9SS type A sorting domain-containing protein [bacterium]
MRGCLRDWTLCVSSDTAQTWAIGSRFDHRYSVLGMGARDELWCALWPDSEIFLVTDTGRTVLDSVFIFHLPTRIYNWVMTLRATDNPGEAYVLANIDYWTYPIRTEVFIYHIQQYGAVVDTFYHELYNYHVATARDVPLLPSGYAICAFPNPFNSSVTLQWNAPSPLPVHVTIWDLLGRTVWSWRGTGDHVVWDGRSDRGVLLSSGTYYVRIEGPIASASIVLPIVLLR